LLLGKFCKAILAFARLNPPLTGVVIEAALSTVCLSRRTQVNMTGTSWALGRENNLHQELVISAPAPDTAILRRGVHLLAGILALLILAFCFFASSICITVILAAFLSILVDPAVRALEKLRIPRLFAAGLIVLTGVLACGFLIYKSYDKLTDFSDEFPSYMSRIADAISPISRKIERVQDSAGKLEHEASPKKAPEIQVRQTTSWTSYLVRGVGSVWGAIIIAGVVPFLVFFMLLARDKIFFCLKTILGQRLDVDLIASRLTGMVRSYAAGNLLIGIMLSGISILVFWWVGLTPAVTLGLISGALNLIPFLGIIVALAVPLMAGVFQFHSAGPFVVIGVTVIALHLIAANFFIPRFVGSRLDVGPVAATIGFLFWGWLWGVAGLLLAVPLTAFIKLLADANPSLAHLSTLLARDPQRFLFGKRQRRSPETTVSSNPS
jgi:predicted PurR-regulated permease PerM